MYGWSDSCQNVWSVRLLSECMVGQTPVRIYGQSLLSECMVTPVRMYGQTPVRMYGRSDSCQNVWSVRLLSECTVNQTPVRMYGQSDSCQNVWSIRLLSECMVSQTPVRMYGQSDSCQNVWSVRLPSECMVGQTPVRMYGQLDSCQNVWSVRLLSECMVGQTPVRIPLSDLALEGNNSHYRTLCEFFLPLIPLSLFLSSLKTIVLLSCTIGHFKIPVVIYCKMLLKWQMVPSGE